MTIRSHEQLRPVAVDRHEEAGRRGRARGYRPSVHDFRIWPHPDESLVAGRDPGCVLPWSSSPHPRMPPEVFLG